MSFQPALRGLAGFCMFHVPNRRHRPLLSSVEPKVVFPISILVVEDDWLIGDDLKATLQDMGYKVLGPAQNCSAALEIILNDRPHLALVDIQLGSETCEAVLDECRLQNVPVVISSGYHPEMMPDFCRDRPTVSKPVDMRQLSAALAIVASFLSSRGTLH